MPYPHKISFSGSVKNWAPMYFDPMAHQKRRDFFRAHDGAQFIETLEAAKDAKTLQQLAFFHGPLLQAIMSVTGNASKSGMKQYLKEEFLGREETINEKRIQVIPSLASMSKRNMREFIDQCMNLLYELGGDLTLEGRNEYDNITRPE